MAFFCKRNMKQIMILIILLISGYVNAENLVSGLVIDAKTMSPVSAARVTVINKNNSSTTDEKGRFSLKNVSTEDVLLVEAYDYAKREYSVRGRNNITISLFPDVFTNYYKKINGISGKVDNSRLVVSAKEMEVSNKTMAISADELIQSGLGGDIRSISRSGIPGVGSSLFIRGINSLNANAQPLIVVDGVIWNSLYDASSVHQGFYSNTLENIDVNDIQSISVLKDGASVYGSKASNGVILIKTKRASTMVTKIGVSVMSGYTSIPGTLPMMKGEDFRVYANDMFGSKGLTGSEVEQLGFLQTDPSNSLYNKFHNNTDWNREVYQTGRSKSYTMDVSGGDDKAFYYFSIGYAGNKGVIKGSDYSRINSRFNADLKLIRQLDLGLNIGFTRNERQMQDDGINFYSSPTWLSKIKSPFMNPMTFTSSGSITTDFDDEDEFGTGNPSAVIANSLNGMKNYSFNIGVKPVYRFNSEFTLSSQFDYNLFKTIERRFVPMTGTAPRMIEELGESRNEINSQVMRNSAIFDETRLTYEKRFDNLNNLTAFAGFRFIGNYYESDYSEEHNTGSDNNTTITGDYDYLQVKGINNETKSLSYFLQTEYDYDNRYFLTAAISLDGSSRFGNNTESGIHLFNQSWGVFPSINGSWLVSSEEFMKNLEAVSFLKLRAGYGLTGNDGIMDYESMAYFSYVKFMDRANGMVLSNLANTRLQWETSGKANLGMDLGLFNDRINLSLDVYSGTTSNLLVLKDAPIISGLGKYWANGGSLNNKGIEVSTDIRVLNLKNLKWEVGFNLGSYKNRIESLENGSYTTSVFDGEIISEVGSPSGSFYGYKTLGVLSTQAAAAEAFVDPVTAAKTYLKIENGDGTYKNFTAGDIQFEDLDKNGIINEKDRQILGNPNPDFYGNISSKIFVNKFSLSTVLAFSKGNDIYNYSRSVLEAGKDFSNQTAAMLNRWTGDGQETDQPKATFGDPMGNSRFSDRWIEDGSYLKLKTITLSYDLSLKSNFIQGINIWFSANNLFTFTNYLGLDPEFSAGNSIYYQGIDAGLLPSTRSFNIGFRFNL